MEKVLKLFFGHDFTSVEFDFIKASELFRKLQTNTGQMRDYIQEADKKDFENEVSKKD